MCGIAGILSANAIDRIEKRIEAMTEVLGHRGPDSHATTIIESGVAFGHSRLSIIDLSDKSNQPMETPEGRYAIVFNGEIYNHSDLRAKISYSFKSSGDTEVALAAIAMHGVEWFVSNANGMFSIAFYDKKKQVLTLIRDRFGIKPLYYSVLGGQIIFSSEVKGVLSSGLIEPVFDEKSIDEYMAFRYVLEPNTFFDNIKQVESGCYMTFDLLGSESCSRYWDLPTQSPPADCNEETLIDEFESRLRSAVNLRMITDVPLGTFLSGGVDSSLLTAMVALSRSDKLSTYTIGFNESEFNEFSYSDVVAEQYGTDHHKITMNVGGYFAEWRNLIGYKDAPLSVPNEIPLAVMSRELKKKITVVLSGEGADELLGGYGRIFRTYFEYCKNNPSGVSVSQYFLGRYEYVSRARRDRLINTCNRRKQIDGYVDGIFAESDPETSIYRFFHKVHVKGLLQRLDSTTMQASVEGRVPFLDHNLVEWVYLNVPHSFRVRWKSKEAMEASRNLSVEEYSEINDTPKYLLRKLAARYISPELVGRKKKGFPVPLESWVGDLNEIAREVLSDVPWLKKSAKDAIGSKKINDSINGQELWMLVNVELFRQKYFFRKWMWS